MVTKSAVRAQKQSKRKRMVRKQVYILPQQEERLKRLAQERETTEANLIRQAIDRILSQPTVTTDNKSLPPDEAAWQAILAFVDQRRAEGVAGEPYKWKREDGYDDERYQRPWAQPGSQI
jgi:hypothetical protein